MNATFESERPPDWLQGVLADRLDLSVEQRADWRVFAVTAAVAVGTDAAVRSGVASFMGAALVLLVAASMAATRRFINPQAMGLAAGAAVFGAFLMVRTSPWLLPLDIMAIGGLLVAAASFGRGGSILHLSIPGAVNRAAHALAHGLAAPVFLTGVRSDDPMTRTRALPVLRGVGLAVPLLVVLGVLLASADAVFASLFDGWDPTTAIVHAVLFGIGAWGMAGLVRVMSAAPPRDLPYLRPRLGATEMTIVLGSVVALFAAFSAAQVVALAGGGRHVIETAGLTYAEYARDGFFQLLAVAAITLGMLVGLRAVVDPEDAPTHRRFVALAETIVVLTLFIVLVALRRLGLYDHTFGLTMLRLYSQLFAVWIAVVFVLLGARVAGVLPQRHWFLPLATVAGLALLLGLNAVNPEAIVVRHNVDHAAHTGRFDPAYLAELSDDAVPALVDALPRLDPAARGQVVASICRPPSTEFVGWAAFNASRHSAADARRRACGVEVGS